MHRFNNNILLSLIMSSLLSLNSYALENKDALLIRTRAFAGSGHFKEAIAELDKIITIDPNDAQIYMMRAFAYNKEGLLDLAIADYSKIIEIEPTNGNAYYNRGFSYLIKKDYSQSWQDINKAKFLGIVINPGILNDLRKGSGRNE